MLLVATVHVAKSESVPLVRWIGHWRSECAAGLTWRWSCCGRLCQPMVDYFLAKGGEFRYNARVQKILLGSDGRVDGFQLTNGSTVKADLYVSAMPGEMFQLLKAFAPFMLAL